MGDEWIMVRVKRSTYQQLERVRNSFRVAETMGWGELEFDSRGRVSLSQVIELLIRHRDLHHARVRRSKARRRVRQLRQDSGNGGGAGDLEDLVRDIADGDDMGNDFDPTQQSLARMMEVAELVELLDEAAAIVEQSEREAAGD